MTEETNTPAELQPAADTTNTRRPGTTRRVLSAVALVAVGVVAGSGATYAATVNSSPTQTQTSGMGRPSGEGGFGGTDGGPGGTPPDGTQQGTQAQGTQPSTTTQTG